ncbi:transposase [Streptomyces sp. NPDC048751]|uniref:transposase n=1 Tax=Streptomyces sp. NPDC048751 TaxID=3365591 RepID=UPI00371C9807
MIGRQLDETIEKATAPFRGALDLLDTIPGINRAVAEVIIAETGGDMSRFPSARHLASWAGACPSAAPTSLNTIPNAPPAGPSTSSTGSATPSSSTRSRTQPEPTGPDTRRPPRPPGTQTRPSLT